MTTNTTEQLIINGPYAMPEKHLKYLPAQKKFEIVPGRRKPGFIKATEGSKTHDDPGIFVELPLVTDIRKHVDDWREKGYPGITSTTKRLLEHWKNRHDGDFLFFFCQIEAMETLIWLAEAPEADKQGIEIPSDGGEFQRVCSKMATGTGKTLVMAMFVAWQVLNSAAEPKDPRFTKNILVVAPGLTVKSRLQVLQPSHPENYYQQYDIIPPHYFRWLRQGRIKIVNWHALAPLDPDAGPRVVKKGAESDRAFAKRVIGDTLPENERLLVINDEAHHAWRITSAEAGPQDKETVEEATIWVGGLDRINRTRKIIRCHDFSATPFVPSGKQSGEDSVFGWIISDFGLNDAIEAGLVKTPRIAIKDDGKLDKEMKSKFYHIYPEVKDDLNRRAEPQEPLPMLITNAYYALGKDWLDKKAKWDNAGKPTPPVMITVCNRTETAARIEYAFGKGKIKIDELRAPDRMLRIDSKALDEAESKDVEGDGEKKAATKKDEAELLRLKVDTVGRVGQPGEKIQNIIAVAMLSEGWDARTVTHIMGLRAFTSQLLCEQVVGRGLRRTLYDTDPETGLFRPEYVNVFGVPFTFLPHEGGEGTPEGKERVTIEVSIVKSRKEHEITWPNIDRINVVYLPKLSLDLDRVEPLELNPEDTPTLVRMAQSMGGNPDVTKIEDIKLEELAKDFRKQRVIFETAVEVYEQVQPTWACRKELLLIQLIKIVEAFLDSDKLVIKSRHYREEFRKRLLIILNMGKIVNHIFSAIRFENTASLAPVFNTVEKIGSTGNMMTWRTSRPCEPIEHSHISHVAFDSTWEASEAFELETSDRVVSWVKNDHLGFVIHYTFNGSIHKYFPDFLIRLKNGRMLVLEVKGIDDARNKAKRHSLAEWVRAVNEHGGFGTWAWDVSFRTSDIKDILDKHAS